MFYVPEGKLPSSASLVGSKRWCDVKLERPLIQPSVLRSLRRLRDPSCFRSFAVWLMFRAVGSLQKVLYRTKLLLAVTILSQRSMILASSKHRPEPRPPTPRSSLLHS